MIVSEHSIPKNIVMTGYYGHYNKPLTEYRPNLFQPGELPGAFSCKYCGC
jgi:hypothetical protein